MTQLEQELLHSNGVFRSGSFSVDKCTNIELVIMQNIKKLCVCPPDASFLLTTIYVDSFS